MTDELLTTLLCEIGERLLLLRAILDDPAVTAKPQARAVAALLGDAADRLVERLDREVVPYLEETTPEQRHAALRVLASSAAAFRVLHRHIGLLDLRWSAAPVDIYLRQWHEELSSTLQPNVTLSDTISAPDELADDVAAHLTRDLAATGFTASQLSEPAGPTLALPRLDIFQPLAWPILLLPLARWEQHTAAPDALGARAGTYGGPAAFAAIAAHDLLFAPLSQQLWPLHQSLATSAAAIASGLEAGAATQATAVSRFAQLLQLRDAALGYAETPTTTPTTEPTAHSLAPSAAETELLLTRLEDGIPISTIESAIPDEFLEQLTSVPDTAAFYDLIAPLSERPASLIAILGVGWLYKLRVSYPTFASLLQGGATLAAALPEYQAHLTSRNELLTQSIEAAHVHGIFRHGRMDP